MGKAIKRTHFSSSPKKEEKHINIMTSIRFHRRLSFPLIPSLAPLCQAWLSYRITGIPPYAVLSFNHNKITKDKRPHQLSLGDVGSVCRNLCRSVMVVVVILLLVLFALLFVFLLDGGLGDELLKDEVVTFFLGRSLGLVKCVLLARCAMKNSMKTAAAGVVCIPY